MTRFAASANLRLGRGLLLVPIRHQHLVNGPPCAVLGVGPEMALGVQRLARGGVPEPGLHYLHALAVTHHEACVVVPTFMEGRDHPFGGDDAGPERSGRRLPP
jgi:hypothetical protein